MSDRKLLDEIKIEFAGIRAKNSGLSAIVKKINSGTATLDDTFKYAELSSELLGNFLSEKIESLSQQDREYICNGLLKAQHDDINRKIAKVQTTIDQKQGLHISPQKATFPTERVQQIAHSLADPTVPIETIQRRANNSVANVSLSFHDDYIQENAKFRNDTGLKCYINRTTDGKCCVWCSAVAGRYEYGKEPSDIYRRHDNCTCSVIFENGRQRQDVWSKKSWNVKPSVKDFKPTVLSHQQAVELQRQNLQYRGLTNGGNGDILRSNGNGIQHTEHTYEKIGEIDFNDKKAVARALQEFEQKYENSRIEHCRVICPNGEIYEVHGDLDTVDTSILGERLKGSINEHNHVIGESQYSFSWEDLISSADDGTKTALAFDEKYRYSMTFPDNKIDSDKVYEAYQKAENAVGEILFSNSEIIPIGDEQNAIIERACKELKIQYTRITR